MEIPSALVNQVRQGRVVLFLGAGATIGAKMGGSDGPPSSDQLRDRITKRFLPSHSSDHSLAWVAELASSATNIFEVQDFIARQFMDLRPATFHSLIPTFVWRGLATTNYDRLIEIVYANAEKRVQAVVPFLSDENRVDHKLRDRSTVALLKLHGCVTRTNDINLPLILSLDQYSSYRDNRSRLYKMFEEWSIENTVVFVGHRIQDHNLRAILLDLTRRFPSRPRYYLVRPSVDDVERDFWASKTISIVDGTLEQFLKSLDAAVDRRTRALATEIPDEHPIQIRWISSSGPSEALLSSLNSEFEFINSAIVVEDTDAKQFYRGAGLGWFPIVHNLDVRRRLTSDILEDVVLRPEDDRPATVELYAIRAEAGAGKSVLLRRLAWDAATDAEALCLFFRGLVPDSLEPLREICESTGERLFVFVDNAAQRTPFIHQVLAFARDHSLKITLITAERMNEWYNNCRSLDDYLTDSYPLRYLSRYEITSLVELLEQNDSLGPHLNKMTVAERIEEFAERAGRQLLVALHEATLGRPFEEILISEYDNLAPPEAKSLYLTVCVLNRLKVPVRAGLISRVHGIPFEDFQNRLFGPLDHVVFVSRLPWGDYAYRARHSEIAQIVFDHVLDDPADRFNEYARILKALNPIYSIDLSSIRNMIRGKWVHRLFPDLDDARAIYDIAFEVMQRDAYLLQQRANYERIRPDGNLKYAEKLLHEARSLSPRDTSIVHTLAEVIRKKAESSTKPLERKKLRSEAGAVLRSISSTRDSNRYADVTRVKLATDEVRDLLDTAGTSERQLDETIRNAERVISDVLQKYPGDQHVLAAEADFAAALSDDERCVAALEKARRANPKDAFVASRLSSLLVKLGDEAKARQYLEEALDGNAGDKRLNFQYASLLRRIGEDNEKLAYHFRRAFSKWDQHHESQFWYARFVYESTDPADVAEAREVFHHLRDVPMSHEDRIKVRDKIGGLDTPREYSGSVGRVEARHGFISVDGRGDWLFFHRSDVASGVWGKLRSGARVVISVAFCVGGARAVDVRLESS